MALEVLGQKVYGYFSLASCVYDRQYCSPRLVPRCSRWYPIRCFFIRDGRIVAVEDLPGLAEQEAIDIGKALFEQTGTYDGIEVWNDSQRVFRMGRVSRKPKKRRRRVVKFR